MQARIFAGWQNGQKNALAVLPTGGGKSIIVSDTVRRFHIANKQSLVMAHRRELVGQMSLHIARQGVRHRVIAPQDVVSAIMAEHRKELNGNCFINQTALTAVGGVDTIVSRIEKLSDYLKSIDLLVCDEGHHVLKSNKWGAVYEACKNALGLQVTATPQRADNKGLGRLADGVADFMEIGPDMRTLIDAGSLTDYEIVCPPSDFDLSKLKEGDTGDYTIMSLKAASGASHIVGDVVENYCKHAYSKRGVCFTTDVETATKIAAQFNAWNIPAMAVSAETDSTVRDDAIRRLRDGRLWMLVNVDLLGEGFDLPAIECVIMARPTASLAVYLQQFGRALRTAPGKRIGLVIDHVSNIKRHGFPDRPRFWTLDRLQKRKPKERDPELLEILICPETGKPYEAIYIANCPHCRQSHVKPPSEGSLRAIEVVAGDLTRLDAATLAEMRAATVLPTPEHMAGRAAFAGHHAGVQAGQANIAAAKIEAQSALKDAIAQWAGFQRWKGRDDSEIHRRFYAATGIDVLSALSSDRSAMINITERVYSWLQKN